MFCVKILMLLVAGLLLLPEGQATYEQMECHECDRMADHCAFRCQWMPTYAKFFYCDDHCKRRDLACQARCKRRNGQPLYTMTRIVNVKQGGVVQPADPRVIGDAKPVKINSLFKLRR